MPDPTLNALKRRLRSGGLAGLGAVPDSNDAAAARATTPDLPSGDGDALIDALPCGVMVLDPLRHLSAINERGWRLLGLPGGFFQTGEEFASLARRASLNGERCLLGLGDLLDRRSGREPDAEPALVSVVTAGGKRLTVQSGRRADGGYVLTFTPPPKYAGANRALVAEEILNSINIAVVRGFLAPDGESFCTYANRDACDVFGIPGETLVDGRRDILAYFDEDARPALIAAIRDSAIDGAPFDVTLPMRDEQGMRHWARCAGQAGYDDGNGLVWDGRIYLRDQRIDAEEERRHLQSLLDNIVENIPYMVTVRDAKDMTYRLVNRAAETQIGSPRETILGKPSARLFGELGSDKQPERTRRMMETGKPVEMPEVVVDTPGNGPRHFRGRKIPLFDQDGAVSHVLTITADITDQRRNEDALRRSEQRLREAIESFTDGLALFDADDRMVLCNRRYRDMWSIDEAQAAPGTGYEALVRTVIGAGGLDRSVADLDDYVASRVARHRAAPASSEHRLANGRWLHVTHRATGEGGISITCTDITALKEREEGLRRTGAEALRAKEAAEAANRSKSDFLANMSHELRTPLNAVIGFSEIIKDALLGEDRLDDYRGYARDIHESGRHLLELINDILDMSKIEAGKLELFEEPLRIEHVIDPCLKLVRERATRSGVALHTEIAADLPPLNADIRKLKQVLINLLSNSVKFTPRGGSVSVAAFLDDTGRFVLRVTDTGTGIRPEDIERALEPFGQVDSGLARAHEGTGLGLTLTKALTELHGGRLDIQSQYEQPPTGTTVSAILPASRILPHDTVVNPDTDSAVTL